MFEYIDLQYRFKRNVEHDKYMKYLISEAKVFNQYKDIMMLSALIGYENEKASEINKSASDGVLMSFFNDKDRLIIDLIAYAHTKNQNVLLNRNKYHIFETYYNGGFPILLRLLDVTESSLDNTSDIYFKELSLRLFRVVSSYDIILNTIDI